MRAAYRIETELLEPENTVTPQLVRHSCTHPGMVEMQVASFQFHRPSVQQESLLGVECGSSHAEFHIVHRGRFPVIRQPDVQCI